MGVGVSGRDEGVGVSTHSSRMMINCRQVETRPAQTPLISVIIIYQTLGRAARSSDPLMTDIYYYCKFENIFLTFPERCGRDKSSRYVIPTILPPSTPALSSLADHIIFAPRHSSRQLKIRRKRNLCGQRAARNQND